MKPPRSMSLSQQMRRAIVDFYVSGIPETRWRSRVEEDSYGQSHLCRLLGNPVAFTVVELLAENKELNPSEIARAVGRSVQRVSTMFGPLRLAEVVRYDTVGSSCGW